MVSFPRHRRGLVLLLASACPAGYSFQSVVVPPPTLPSSEDLHYSIEWRLINAGKAHLSWGAAGASGFQTNLHLESAGLASRLLHLDDECPSTLSGGLQA